MVSIGLLKKKRLSSTNLYKLNPILMVGSSQGDVSDTSGGLISAVRLTGINKYSFKDITELYNCNNKMGNDNRIDDIINRYKNKIDNYVLKPYSKLSLGEFIDLEYYFSNNYLDHFCHILALLYRRTSKNVYGDDIIEPYDYSPRDRLDWYLDYPITDVYGLIPEYIKYYLRNS